MRNAMAQLLGYKNHAEYAISVRMAKSPVKVLRPSFVVLMYIFWLKENYCLLIILCSDTNPVYMGFSG